LASPTNSKGEEQRMSVVGKVNGSGGFGRGGKVDLNKVLARFKGVDPSGGGQLGARGELQATLDLAGEANRENRLATRRFPDGRDPITGAPADRLASAQGLFRRFEDEASVNVRAYATGETTTGFRAKATVVGAEASLESKEATLIGAWCRARDGGFRQWTGCRR